MPHKVPTVKRFRISNDVLICILEKLSPTTLYATCQAFERVCALVMEFQHLRYRFKLAHVGMKDGLAPYAVRPPMMRLQLLTAYERDWPRLKWLDEQKVRIPATAHISVSGSMICWAAGQILELAELPSWRTGKMVSDTRHVKFSTSPDANDVAVDPLQTLVVTAHAMMAANNQATLRLKIRHQWTFEKHPKSIAPQYSCNLAQPVTNVSTVICGNRLVCTVEFAGGLTKHLLMDWCTMQAMWLEEQDVVLLNPRLLLGIRKVQNRIVLYLYDISNMSTVTLQREYELPPIWANSILRFARNGAPNADVTTSSTLFYSDPSARVLVLTATSNDALHWLFVPESFFRPTSYADRRSVPWVFWSQFSLIKQLSLASVVGSPQIVNSRVVYLEKDGTKSQYGTDRTRLRIIDFAPCAEIPPASPQAWTHRGQHCTLKPGEHHRDFSANSSTTSGLAVEKIAATEDNIILFLENFGDTKPVNILTFGPSPQKAIRQEAQYH